ncbi:hypothetical protein [Nocardia huaxiensis]|uniref:hypothetical protein n=1 Tax=Nocardia huaxiensis TaxID=2755382 RepID=UPI001E5635E4|nr:hypothetical protein [Nocardia huaxiensis]UFS97878.1 hypothetical protein LPY97_08250 [Nocardia huaxiensis]
MTEHTTTPGLPVRRDESVGAERARVSVRIMWILGALAWFFAGIAALVAGMLSARFRWLGVVPVWGWAACWTVAVVFLALGPAVCRQRKRVWITLAALLGVVTAPLWALTLFAVMWDDNSKVVATTVSPDGRLEAVTEEFYNVIDPSCRVRIRERAGLLSRQFIVWKRIEASCPTDVSFLDNSTISITPAGSQNPVTIAIDTARMQGAD